MFNKPIPRSPITVKLAACLFVANALLLIYNRWALGQPHLFGDSVQVLTMALIARSLLDLNRGVWWFLVISNFLGAIGFMVLGPQLISVDHSITSRSMLIVIVVLSAATWCMLVMPSSLRAFTIIRSKGGNNVITAS